MPSERLRPPAFRVGFPRQLAGRRPAAVDSRESGGFHAVWVFGHGQGPERGVRGLRRQVFGEALRPVYMRGYVLCSESVV